MFKAHSHRLSDYMKRATRFFEVGQIFYIVEGLCIALSLTLSMADHISIGFGLVLFVLGLLWRVWSISYEKPHGVLVTGGPYAFVRHPYYLGRWLCALGLIVASKNAWVTAAYVVSTSLVLFWIMQAKEADLTKRYGDQFRHYKNSVSGFFPQLIPGLGMSWAVLFKDTKLRHFFSLHETKEQLVVLSFIFLFGFHKMAVVYDLKNWLRVLVGVCVLALVLFWGYRESMTRSKHLQELF